MIQAGHHNVNYHGVLPANGKHLADDIVQRPAS